MTGQVPRRAGEEEVYFFVADGGSSEAAAPDVRADDDAVLLVPPGDQNEALRVVGDLIVLGICKNGRPSKDEIDTEIDAQRPMKKQMSTQNPTLWAWVQGVGQPQSINSSRARDKNHSFPISPISQGREKKGIFEGICYFLLFLQKR